MYILVGRAIIPQVLVTYPEHFQRVVLPRQDAYLVAEHILQYLLIGEYIALDQMFMGSGELVDHVADFGAWFEDHNA